MNSFGSFGSGTTGSKSERGERGMCIYSGAFEDALAQDADGAAECRDDESRRVLLPAIEIGGEQKVVSIRLVHSTARIEAARELINDRYAWRGYGRGHTIITDPYHLTFTAEIDGEVVGTITLGIDSAKGIAADRGFRDRTDELRAGGAAICELKRFAFSPAIQSKEVMAALFHTVFVYGSRTFGCTDLLIEVNERHVRFYEAMLRFERIGTPRHNEVINMPVQLMRLQVARIREYIDNAADSSASERKRSLYGYFLSPEEEEGIFLQLAGTPAGRERQPERRPISADWRQVPSWQSYPIRHATSSAGSPTGMPLNHV